MTQEPSIQAWRVPHTLFDSLVLMHLENRPASFTALAKLFQEPQYLTSKPTGDDANAGLTEIDYEEQTAGYQAAYSRLAASESAAVDPVAYVRDPKEFLGTELTRVSKANGQQLKALIQAGDPEVVGPFVQSLAAIGYSL